MDFYTKVARRPLKELDQSKSAETFDNHIKHWQKQFENSNDITVWSWREIWKKNIATNLKEFGYFHRDHSVKVFANELIDKPCILVGAGSSLENNMEHLKTAKEMGVAIIASSHSFMYLSDIGVKPDYVVQLDAGGQWDEYLAGDSTGVPLLCDITCNTKQLKAWSGPKFFFSSTLNNRTNAGRFYEMERDRICVKSKLGSIIETGGHVGGAMLTLARTIMQSNKIMFTGYDYCFSPDKKFYPFDKEIDKSWTTDDGEKRQSPPYTDTTIPDIFGEACETDGSYLGFKTILDNSIRIMKVEQLAKGGDVEFINACEGGALGAIPGGNSKWMQYLRLEDALIATK